MTVYIYTTLVGPSGSGDALPNGINNQGQIVGSYNDAITTHGFLYLAGAYTTVDDPVSRGEFTVANGINESGQIVGYYLDGNGDKHGFLDSGGTYTTLDYPSARQTFAQGINDAGQMGGVHPAKLIPAPRERQAGTCHLRRMRLRRSFQNTNV